MKSWPRLILNTQKKEERKKENMLAHINANLCIENPATTANNKKPAQTKTKIKNSLNKLTRYLSRKLWRAEEQNDGMKKTKELHIKKKTNFNIRN